MDGGTCTGDGSEHFQGRDTSLTWPGKKEGYLGIQQCL